MELTNERRVVELCTARLVWKPKATEPDQHVSVEVLKANKLFTTPRSIVFHDIAFDCFWLVVRVTNLTAPDTLTGVVGPLVSELAKV